MRLHTQYTHIVDTQLQGFLKNLSPNHYQNPNKLQNRILEEPYFVKLRIHTYIFSINTKLKMNYGTFEYLFRVDQDF